MFIFRCIRKPVTLKYRKGYHAAEITEMLELEEAFVEHIYQLFQTYPKESDGENCRTVSQAISGCIKIIYELRREKGCRNRQPLFENFLNLKFNMSKRSHLTIVHQNFYQD